MRSCNPIRFALTMLGSLLLVGGVCAQGNLAEPFAYPWEIDLVRIKDAMEGRSYRVTQVRRVWEETAVTLPNSPDMHLKRALLGTRELMHLRPTSKGLEFSLVLQGIEGRQMTASELAVKRRQFQQNERTMFQHHGFRVVDPVQAAANYAVYYLGKVKRLDRPCYRVVVLPKSWDRSAWLLDLDRTTGYPLYQGQYDLGARLLGEIQVKEFEPDANQEALDVTWSQPSKTSQRMPNESLALRLALAGRTQVVPPASILPKGFKRSTVRLVKGNYLTGKKTSSVVIVYTDGVADMFCLQRSVPRQKGAMPEQEHRMFSYNTRGLSESLFTHAGVEFRVMGGASRSLVTGFSQSLYRVAVQSMR